MQRQTELGSILVQSTKLYELQMQGQSCSYNWAIPLETTLTQGRIWLAIVLILVMIDETENKEYSLTFRS